MSHDVKVGIPRLATGVPGLDAVLGGGLPELSFNIFAGSPGSGKTTLAHQIIFANATPARPALYFTVLGEPALKMLRYQQQFQFFDPAKVGTAIRFINLSQVVLEQDLAAVLAAIAREVEAASPAFVVVDSFRTLVRKAGATPTAEVELQAFVQRLALHLTSWQATSFLLGEYGEGEIHNNPVFTVADGETARAGVRARAAYLPHHRGWTAGLPAHPGPDGPAGESGAPAPPVDRDRGPGHDAGRRLPRRG